MTWRTVVLTKDSKISLRLNHLVIMSDEMTTIPLSEIGQVVIDNPNIVMTGHILNALSQNKITTIICNNKHMPFSHLNLIYGHFRQVMAIKKQLSWTPLRKDMLWQHIIKHKINNQKRTLNTFYQNSPYDNFDSYIKQVELGDETNREGHAAKVYFNQLFGLGFIRGEDTPINWGLNYGYSLLLSLFTKIITTKGLLTEVGIHHRNQYNHYNLASDFMEVYRPVIDIIVKSHITVEFDTAEKQELLDVFNKKVRIKNKNQYLANSVEIYVDSLISYMDSGDVKRLAFPTLIGAEVNV
ncbi:type II CRISPR-associated endonuclease Cas1 [Pseudogracilibacillus auburnensis]|uniref:type II CRISPR-associated endonuclease Cas1 n=1 Tax=Pseudogracilibacillus auburnensis TaxID=1494959 RepID=UPI001F6009CA|nr:type II CRISPR-associated endonuclease Cas1 [Pseudogracilibacillus auburnensis]